MINCKAEKIILRSTWSDDL